MKKFKIIITLLILISLSGCSNISDYQKSIYDDNTKIIAEGDTYFYKSRIGNVSNDDPVVKIDTFYGMETLSIIKSQGEGTITINYDTKISKGKFKCVLIDPNNKIIELFTQSHKGTMTIDMKKGTSRIKIVGYDANGKFNLSIKGDGDSIVE